MRENKPYMDVIEIRKRIPHRFPFLLIDRVDSFTPGSAAGVRVGRKVVARKNVTVNEEYFQGHFPHAPIMPGVLQVEAMAQAGALACVIGEDEPMDVRIAKIENARFRKPVVPGSVLEVTRKSQRKIRYSLRARGNSLRQRTCSEVDIVAKAFRLTEV